MSIIKCERIPCKFYFNTDKDIEKHGTYLIRENGRIEIEIFDWAKDRLQTRDLYGDSNIPEFNYVSGFDTRGNSFHFYAGSSSMNIGSHGFNHRYSNFRYGVFWRCSSDFRSQNSFEKIHLKIDHLSTFFSDLGKLKLMNVFKDNLRNLDFYQITADRKKDELCIFRLGDYILRVKSYVKGLGLGNYILNGNCVNLDVKEMYFLEIRRDIRGKFLDIQDIEELQAFFQRFLSFAFQSNCYIRETSGYIGETCFEIISENSVGLCSPCKSINCLFDIKTINRFEFIINNWWNNRSKFATLYGYTLSNILKDNNGYENLLSNYFKGIENYLNVVIKLPLYNEFVKSNHWRNCKNGTPKLLKMTDNRPTWKEKFTYLIDNSDYLNNHLKLTINYTEYFLKLKKALMHGDAVDQNNLIKAPPFNLAFILERIAKYCFLKSLGFGEGQIIRILKF